MSKTHVPLEFSELLRSASALISSIPPDALADLLEAAALGLEGRTDSLRALAEQGDRLTAALVTRTAALDRLAVNNTRLTKVVADHRGALGQSLTDLRELAESLRTSAGDTNVLLTRGARLHHADWPMWSSHQKGNLDCDLKTLELVVDTTSTPERVRGSGALLEVGPVAFSRVWDARDVDTTGPSPGVWVRVGLVTQPANPPVQYVPAKEPPTVRTVPACASTLRPSGVDYRPRRRRVPGVDPRRSRGRRRGARSAHWVPPSSCVRSAPPGDRRGGAGAVPDGRTRPEAGAGAAARRRSW